MTHCNTLVRYELAREAGLDESDGSQILEIVAELLEHSVDSSCVPDFHPGALSPQITFKAHALECFSASQVAACVARGALHKYMYALARGLGFRV